MEKGPPQAGDMPRVWLGRNKRGWWGDTKETTLGGSV